jgi:CheY-like chemotaxis protein
MARVLVVEDDQDVADSLATLFELDGHEVVTVDNGLAALSEVDRRMPDAVVLDIGLPALDGIQVATRLRRTYGRALQLIACTAYVLGDLTHQGIMHAGFDAIFTKPTPVDELLRAIRNARSGWRQNVTDRRAEPRRRLLSPT